jgi:hypothetical protein
MMVSFMEIKTTLQNTIELPKENSVKKMEELNKMKALEAKTP